jgi:hypothetical protein
VSDGTKFLLISGAVIGAVLAHQKKKSIAMGAVVGAISVDLASVLLTAVFLKTNGVAK